ncbi:carboxypeptidase-like regulatory domain-containing protein [Flavobacteriaceae bacterium MHTCC 0001]
MKQLYILLGLLLTFKFSLAQNTPKISLEFENNTLFEAIALIEENTNYTFFFQKEWLNNTKISGSYPNTDINNILDDLFKSTNINYFITEDNRIILTSNSLIVDELPKNYFNITPSQNETKEDINKTDPVNIILSENITSSDAGSNKTVRIGKESINSKKNTYTLSGYITNASTNTPIANLLIFTSDKKISTETNDKGYYSMNLPYGVNYINTKGLGLTNTQKKVIMYNNGNLNIKLKDNLEALDEVVVEADRDKNIKSVLGGVVQIKTKDIKTIPLILGERDILKVATTLPGIVTTGEGSSGYNVRGGREDQNLILLDNGTIYNPSHFFGIFSALNPYTTGDANIYKGNIPSEFGGRTSSVFDIKTRNGSTEKITVEASVGPVTSNLSADIPVVKNKSSLVLGARGTYSGWILRSLDDKSLKNSEASFYDIVGKYNHKIDDKNTVEATGYYSKDAFSITSDSLFSYSNRMTSLKWHHKLNEKHSGDLIVSNSQYEFNIEFEGVTNTNFNLDYKINETEFKIKMKYLMNKTHKFDYGISSKLYTVNPGTISPLGEISIIEETVVPKEKALESAIFLSDNLKLNNRISLNLGARVSLFNLLGPTSQRIYSQDAPKNSAALEETVTYGNNEIAKTYGGAEFRIGSRFYLNDNLSIKAGINTGYQYIHMLSNNTTVSPTATWKLSDVNIKPQHSTQFALGLFNNLEDNLYELSVEGYYKLSQNLLDYRVGADLLINETIETEVLQGDGRAWGVEFLIKKTKGRFNGWLGYTYSRSFIKLASEFAQDEVNNGDYFPSNFDKPHNLNFVGNYKLTKRFSLSSNFTYQTGRPVTIPTGNFNFNGETLVTYSDRNQYRIPDYYRLDLGLNIEGNHKLKKLAHSFWNISVYNVLGRNNPYSVFFVTENGEIKSYQSSIFAIPVPTITYNLKF